MMKGRRASTRTLLLIQREIMKTMERQRKRQIDDTQTDTTTNKNGVSEAKDQVLHLFNLLSVTIVYFC